MKANSIIRIFKTFLSSGSTGSQKKPRSYFMNTLEAKISGGRSLKDADREP
ncbi:MAG: hypothetical protein LUQ22_03190 [Methanotrichaceae archaeon]|nr:hypothetical protein [Methanotrichaceae archaeon]